MVPRDGQDAGARRLVLLSPMRSYTAADGKSEGRGHQRGTLADLWRAPDRGNGKVVTIGFTGPYTDETAEGDGMAPRRRTQSIRFRSKLRLLVAERSVSIGETSKPAC